MKIQQNEKYKRVLSTKSTHRKQRNMKLRLTKYEKTNVGILRNKFISCLVLEKSDKHIHTLAMLIAP